MAFFAMVDKHNDGSPMVNLRIGGFKNKDAAVSQAKRFENAMVKIFNGKRMVVVYAKVHGEELIH